MNMNLLLFHKLSERMLIFPLTHLFYKILFLEKYFRISVCKIVQFHFNINVIKGIDHSQNIEMIFLMYF